MPTVSLNASNAGYQPNSGVAITSGDLYNGYVTGKGSFYYSFAVKWNVSSIPSSASVVSAYFDANQQSTNTTTSGHASFNVYKATNDWTTGTVPTWDTGTNYGPHNPYGETTGYHQLVVDSANFRALVLGWVNGSVTNNGLYAPSNGDTANGYVIWDGTGKANLPRLVVSYTVPMPPNVPTGLNSSSVLATTATIGWTAPAVDGSHNAATSYTLQRALDAGFATGLTSWGGLTGTSFNATGLTSNTTYYWRVSATNADGTSAYSASINFKTLASQMLVMVGAPSAQVFNTVVIKAKKTIIPTGAPTAETFNIVTILKRNTTVQPGIPSVEAFNIVTIFRGPVTTIPTGVPSAEAFGLPLLNRVFRVTLAGAPSAEAFNIVTIFRGAVTATLVGAPSAEAFNPVTIKAKNTIVLVGAPSAQIVNPVALLKRITLALLGAPSAQAVDPVVVRPGSRTVVLVGAPSFEAFGIPRYNVRQTVVLVSVPSGEVVNPIALLKRITLLPPSIVSAGVVNAIGNVLRGTVRLYPSSIASFEVFGTIFVVKIITYVAEGVDVGRLRIAPSGFIIVTNPPFLGGLWMEDQPRLVLTTQPLPEGGLVVLSQYDQSDSGVEV